MQILYSSYYYYFNLTVYLLILKSTQKCEGDLSIQNPAVIKKKKN